MVTGSADPVWLATIGPATNAAAALDRYPELRERLAGIAMMGGRRDPAQPHEHNFGVDGPALPRDSDGWLATYGTRQAVERVFSRLKGHRALNGHCRRGLERVALHCVISVLALQAGALVAATDGRLAEIASCTRKVA